jgi:hypothetical protein
MHFFSLKFPHIVPLSIVYMFIAFHFQQFIFFAQIPWDWPFKYSTMHFFLSLSLKIP